jgi:hypothetical protein
MAILTPEDIMNITRYEQDRDLILQNIWSLAKFKVGDFLILKMSEYRNGPIKIQVDSYGAPIKFLVVHVTPGGMPWLKRVNNKGLPTGHAEPCFDMETAQYHKFEFELDPDYTDSILLQDKYDPCSLQRSKKVIWKEVTEHNKANKIPTRNIKDIMTFFETVTPGDTLWTSSKGSRFVKDKKVVKMTDYFRKTACHGWKQKDVPATMVVLTVTDNKGNDKDIDARFFHWKALYKQRPRSYKELNI